GMGVAFHETLVLAQAAELVGATGLAFLPMFMAAVVVQVARRLHGEARRGKRLVHWDFAAAATLLAVAFLFGVFRLQGWKPEEVVPLRVLAVQLNIPQEASRVLWSLEEVHGGYEDETLRALNELEEANVMRMEEELEEGEGALEIEMPDWVLWPESALKEWLLFTGDGLQVTGPANRLTLERVLGAGSFTLLMGLNEIEAVLDGDIAVPVEGGDSYNSLLALPPGAERFLSYRKQHLVMFGETIPYQDQLPILRKFYEMSAGVEFGGGFSTGSGDEPLRIPHPAAPDGQVAVIPSICFEDTVPRLLRKYVHTGGQLIVNVTNDGWFKDSEAAAQHFANARFRSIELRRPMVRCSNTGVTAVVGANGSVYDPLTGSRRVLEDESGNHLTRGWLFATAYVPVDGPVTLYARGGDWLSAGGFLLGLGWWLTARWRRR
ncbi:MAG: apolipoprotein N-acyltransferase, partial [Akkermansiaceae bacterium]|nr:apolipoprotein N-acyltransferase [Akkermansiaceae bacterium]